MSESPGQDAAKTPTDPHHLPHTADWEPDGPQTSGTDIEDVLRRRVSARLRVAQALALMVVIAVVAGLVVHTLPVAPGRSQAGMATPTPVPLGPVLLLSNVSYGTVTLNGTRLAGPTPLVATFRRGLNTVTLTAPPFRPRTCHVQWPGRQNDGGCDFPTTVGLPHSVAGRPVSPVLIVVLPFGPDDLPSAAQAQALAAVTDALRSAPPQTRALAGEYIATGQDARGAVISQRTTVTLQATLLVEATSVNYFGDVFCGDPACVPVGNATTGQRAGQSEWVVSADMTLHWQFSSSAGVVASSAYWSAQLPASLLLTYDAQQGWTFDQSGTQQLAGFGLPAALAQAICTVDSTVLSSAAQQHGDTILSPLHDNGVEGCELEVQTSQGTEAGHFVWRFGVLLAADGPAHALLPALPLAPASELAAVGG